MVLHPVQAYFVRVSRKNRLVLPARRPTTFESNVSIAGSLYIIYRYTAGLYIPTYSVIADPLVH
jgi:hypothetical protein